MANDRRNRPLIESSFTRGIHGGLSPDALPDGYLAQALNVSIRGGSVSTRPRFSVVGTSPASAPFQGAGVYSLESGDVIIFGVGNEVRAMDMETGAVSLLYTFPSSAGPHYHVQADRFFIVQNGVDRPVFHHRGVFTRVATADGAEDRELPTGTLMAYAHGRVFLVPRYLYDANGDVTAEDGRAYWLAGDILLPLNAENVLKVAEDEYWNEGGATALPFESGVITGLGVLQNAQASGSGLGALVAFGRSGVSAYVVAANRSDWKNLDFSQVLFTGAGTLSPKSLVPVNDDLLFRGTDGIRSLRSSSTQAMGGSGWSVRPVSYEVSHRLRHDTAADLPYVTASFADNRFLMPTGGRFEETGDFRGLISLDTLVAASLDRGSAPAYDDLWTCSPVCATLRARMAGEPRHIIVFRQGGNYVFATTSDTGLVDFNGEAPVCRAYSRAYSTMTGDLVSLTHLDVIFRNIRGPLVARAWFRSDFYDRWTPLSGTLEVDGLTRRQARFAAPMDGCREDGTPPHVGQSLQVCIEWTGVASIERWSLAINPVQSDPSVLSVCNSTTAILSPGLDAIMQPLEDFDTCIP